MRKGIGTRSASRRNRDIQVGSEAGPYWVCASFYDKDIMCLSSDLSHVIVMMCRELDWF